MLIFSNFLYLSSNFPSPIFSFPLCQINGVSVHEVVSFISNICRRWVTAVLNVNEMSCLGKVIQIKLKYRPSPTLSVIGWHVFFSLPEGGDYLPLESKQDPSKTQNLMWSNLFNFTHARIPNSISPNPIADSKKNVTVFF